MNNNKQQNKGWHGTGEYTAVILPLSLPREHVVAMLPTPLTLAPQSLTATNKHLILFMLGAQRNVRPQPFSLFRWSYLEGAVAVPYVTWRDQPTTEPLFFMPKLFLNRTRPIMAGTVYGFAKTRATIGMSDDHYIINDYVSNKLILSALFEYQPEGRVDSNAVSQLLLPTLVGQLGGRDRFATATFDWCLETAVLQPITATLTLVTPFLTGLTPDTYAIPSLTATPFGAFHITANWTLSRPHLKGI